MEHGLQVFNESGALMLDISDRVAQILGVIDTNSVDGSVSVAGFELGVPFIIATAPDSEGGYISTQPDLDMPSITANGTTLSWAYYNQSRGKAQTRIVYGIY